MGASLTVVCITTMERRTSAARAMETIARHYREAMLRTVVVDDLVAENGARFVDGLFPPREFARRALLHDGPSLIAALRPVIVRAVAAGAPGRLIVVPDDAEVFGPLDPLLSPLDGEHAVVVVRNRFAPPPPDGQLPDSIDAALRGRHDQDLLALRTDDARAVEFLDAWAACLERSPHIPTHRLDPMTYPWLDSLSERDGVAAIVDASLPLSVRNADEPLRQGTPVLVRWPAFDPSTPWILSSETGTLPRVRATTNPQLAAMANERARALIAATDDDRVGAFAFLPDGLAVDPVIRAAYAAALLRFESGNEAEPPNPFADDKTTSFLTWLSTPRGNEPSPYVDAFQRVHTELLDALPTTDALTAWMRDRGAVAGIPSTLRPTDSPPEGASPTTAELQPGMDISGYFGAQFGMGAAARALVAAASAAEVPHTITVDTRSAYHADHISVEDTTASGQPDGVPATFVVVRNADALLADPSDVRAARAAGRRVVGYWFWEVATFPDRLRAALELVDEVWVATAFVADSLRAVTEKPVHVMPFVPPAPLDAEERLRARERFIRAQSIGDERFVVSFSFDFDSVADRKNPWGVVAAYRQAFPNEGVALADGRVPLLVLKAIGGQRHPIDHDRLLHSVSGRRDVLLIGEHLDADMQQGLFARSDVYVSLHRGEGLGLTVLEAWAAGCPVICTAYGGNMSFCTDETAFMVPFELIEIPPATPVYAGCGVWAEPSIDAAASYLRTIADEPSVAAAKVDNARGHLAALRDERAVALTDFLRLHTSYVATPSPQEDYPMTEVINETSPTAPVAAAHRGLGPVVLPGASTPTKPGGTGVLGAVTDRVRATVEPMLAAQAAFEQTRIVALVDAVQQTRQAVLDIEANASAERQTLTDAISGAATHTANLQANHDSLYASVTELSTQVRTLMDSHLDVHAAVRRIDGRLDAITTDLRALLDRLPR